MNRFFLLSIILVPSTIFAQDHIIFRDGQERECKVIQVNSDKTLCKENNKKKALDVLYDNSEIYMIKYEKRGNVFFTEDGDRFSGETVDKPDKKATMIYLKQGKEIEAFDLEITSTTIRFKPERRKTRFTGFIFKNSKIVETQELEKTDVFMLKYPDGTKDILTPFEIKKEKEITSGDLSTSPISSDKKQIVENPVKVVSGSDVRRSYPCGGIIQTVQGATIDAIIQNEDDESVAYKRQSNPNGPIYHIKLGNIKDIKYTKLNLPETKVVKENVGKKTDEKESISYPRKAIIKTKKGLKISAIIYSDNGIVVAYKMQKWPKGKTYYIKHSSIQQII